MVQAFADLGGVGEVELAACGLDDRGEAVAHGAGVCTPSLPMM